MPKPNLSLILALLLCVGPWAVPRTALGQEQKEATKSVLQSDELVPERDMHVSALLDFGSYGALMWGIGAIGSFPIVENGFLRGVNDVFLVEGGFKFASVHFSGQTITQNIGFGRVVSVETPGFTQSLLHPFGGVRWDFNFTEALSAYPLVRLGALISVEGGGGGFYFATGVGGHWRFAESFGLRAELVGGSASGVALSVGASMFF